MPRLRLLLLEDEPDDAELALAALSEAGYACEAELADGGPAFERAFQAGRFDIVIADYHLHGYTGLDALAVVRRADALLPFILLSGALGEARLLGVAPATVLYYDRTGRLKSERTEGGMRLFRRVDVERFARERAVEPFEYERVYGAFWDAVIERRREQNSRPVSGAVSAGVQRRNEMIAWDRDTIPRMD